MYLGSANNNKYTSLWNKYQNRASELEPERPYRQEIYDEWLSDSRKMSNNFDACADEAKKELSL